MQRGASIESNHFLPEIQFRPQTDQTLNALKTFRIEGCTKPAFINDNLRDEIFLFSEEYDAVSDFYDTINNIENRRNHYHIHCVRGKGAPKWLVYKYMRAMPLTQFTMAVAFSLVNLKNRTFLYGTDDPEIAVFTAYSMDQANEFYENLSHEPLSYLQDNMAMLRTMDREYRIDTDYHELVAKGEPVAEVKFEPPLGPQVGPSWTPSTDDEEYPNFNHAEKLVYEAFEKIVDEHITGSPVPTTNSKFSGHAIGDTIVDIHDAKHVGGSRKKIDMSRCIQDVKEHGYRPLVGCIPKHGVVTSDGRPRAIFPMHYAYEAALRYLLRFATYVNNEIVTTETDLWKFGKFHNYAYDITKCDKTMFPYLFKYAVDKGKTWLIPTILHQKKYYKPKQMCSGIYGTSLLVNWFTSAVIAASNMSGKVNGDAIVPTRKVTHLFNQFCKKEKRESLLNGFLFDEDTPKYYRAEKILSDRSKKKTPAEHRYAIIYASYKYMNAPDIQNYARDDIRVFDENGKHYTEWTNVDVGRFMNHHHYPEEINAIDGLNYNSNASNWDHLIVTGVHQDIVNPRGIRRERLV
jgi:hypothetical protein